MDRFTSYKPKLERAEEANWRNINQRRGVINIEPKTNLEMVILSQYKEIKNNWRKIPVDEAIAYYNAARYNKHDLWCEYINNNAASASYVVNDIEVRKFVQITMEQPHIVVPKEISSLTPDILILHESKQFIYLGDVACSEDEKGANKRKYIKYLEVKNFFENVLEIKVKHMNFIIKNDLSNVNSVINEFVTHDLVFYNPTEIERTKHFFKLAIKIMDESQKMCEDQQRMMVMQSMLDREEKIKCEDAELYPDIEWCELKYEDATEEDEDAIIDQIKTIVDDEVETFFDDGYEATKNAFDELYDQNRLHEHTGPKGSLKCVYNTYDKVDLTDLALAKDYLLDILKGDENKIKGYITSIFPTTKQLDAMQDIGKDTKKEEIKALKELNVFGKYQYIRPRKADTNNEIVLNFISNINKGKKQRNTKTTPKTINPDEYDICHDYIENMAAYLGTKSCKPPFLDDTWLVANNMQMDSTADMKDTYNYVKTTNGAQLAQAMSNLYQRLTHLKTSLSTKDNIYIPPNGSFITIIPKEHAPMTSSNCDVPMIFITRYNKHDDNLRKSHNEYEYYYEGDRYIYLISKLCRLNLDKIENWDQAGYKVVTCSSYLLNNSPKLEICKELVIGYITILILDCHQKTSEFLDLLKYVAYMPFADITCLSKLVMDKFNIMVKTRLDAWVLKHIEKFMTSLSQINFNDAKKPKVQMVNGEILRDSLGLDLKLNSFTLQEVKHDTIMQFIEEVTMFNIIRGKQLYGSQFMDKSINCTAEWNLEYDEERTKYGNWVVDGTNDDMTNYPFESKFAFHRKAMILAQKHFLKNVPINASKVARNYSATLKNNYMHYNCSLRGCVKEPEMRSNLKDIHTTSMESCLEYYKSVNYNDKHCEAQYVASQLLRQGKTMEFGMSEKKQRGGGRPIATPTLLTKAALMMIEKPEIAVGKCTPNNILVEGKNKLQEQSECYKRALSKGAEKGFKQIYQLTEDQQKYSENDNVRKYEPIINNNTLLPSNTRRIQKTYLMKINDRLHYVKREPKAMLANKKLERYIVEPSKGVKGIIGWPQGMLNFMSTTVHSIADYWITYAFNKAYPDEIIISEGLVHSDDSWVTVVCNDLSTFKKFSLFRIYAKKLFCLKANIKKLWGSRMLGELVSNYNINGNVHLSQSKIIANSLQNLIYQNYPMDVQSQVSSMQQIFRSGANLSTLVLLGTVLKQQLLDSYKVTGLQREYLDILPIELGGYPSNSPFELAVSGTQCHYMTIYNFCKANPDHDVTKIILNTLRLSMKWNTLEEETFYENYLIGKVKTSILKSYGDLDEDAKLFLRESDYSNVVLPDKQSVFSCIQFLLPQSKKVTRTVAAIKGLPFIGDGLEMIVTKPNKLSVALGHLKDQVSTMLYSLASEHYTQSVKRLAINQALQSSGNNVKLRGTKPTTINKLLHTLLTIENLTPCPISILETAFVGDNDLINLTNSVVHNSELEYMNNDKRRIINRLPEYDNKYKVVCRFSDVILYIIDTKTKSDLINQYGSGDKNFQLLDADSKLLINRFQPLFHYYDTIKACSTLCQMYLSRIKSKLWMQPFLRNDSLVNFICDLYGKTIDNKVNYKVMLNIKNYNYKNAESDIVTTLYSTTVLNELYDNKFILQKFKDKDIKTAINTLDYNNLSNDDFLKYAALQMYINNDNSYIKKYDEINLYQQRYTLRQEIINNKYVGPFKCQVSYGRTKLIIEGEPEDVKITSNTTNINDILYAMMFFCNKNFSYYKYSHPTLWATTGFYNTKNKFIGTFLVAYSNSSTVITQRATNTSVCIHIDKTLNFTIQFLNIEDSIYSLEENNRVVFKTFKHKDKEIKVRVGVIHQNLSMPLVSDVNLEPDVLQGYSNDMLLKSKVLVNLTLKRTQNLDRQMLIELMNNKIPSINSAVIGYFYKCILSKFPRCKINNPFVWIENEEQELNIQEYEVTGQNITEFLDNEYITTAENLDVVEQEFIYDDTERVGKMTIHKNITKFLSKTISPHMSQLDLEDVIWHMFRDQQFKKETFRMSQDWNCEDDLDEVIEVLKDSDICTEIFCILVGNDLLESTFWDNIDLKKIIISPMPNNYSAVSHKVGTELVKMIKEEILDIEEEDDDIDDIF